MRSPARDDSSRTFLVVATAVAAYAAWFYRDLLAGRVYVFRDMYTMFLAYEHTARQLSHVAWPPLWNPFAVLGKPFMADPVTGVFYPPNWVLRQLPVASGMALSIVLHHLLAAGGAYALLRFHKIDSLSAALGALLFSFGGVFVSLDTLVNGLQSATWMPWVVLAFALWSERRTVASAAALSATLALALLGAMPELLLFANILAIALAVDRARTGVGPGLIGTVAVLAAANLGAFALSAVQVLPFAELVRHSSRLGGLSTAAATTYSLEPLGVVAFALPRRYVDAAGHFHETAGLWEGTLANAPWILSMYFGVSLTLLVPAWGRCSRFQRWWWGGIALGAVLLSLGSHLPGYAALMERTAVLRMVRYPEKFLLLAHALLAAGAALGLEAVRHDPVQLRRLRWSAAGGALAALIVHRIAHATATWPAALVAGDMLVLALLCALVSAATGFLRNRSDLLALALLLLAAIDLYRVNGRLFPTAPWETAQRVPASVALMERSDEPLRIYSNGFGRPPLPAFPEGFVQEQNLLLMHDSSYYDIGNLYAPATLNLRDHEDLEQLLEDAPRERTAALLATLDTRYVTSSIELNRPGMRVVHRPVDPLDVYVFAIEPTTGRVFVPSRVRPTSGAQQAIDDVRNSADLPHETVLDAAAVPPNLPTRIEGTARLVSYQPQRVEIAAHLRTPGVVVLADSYYPGWQVSVDDVDGVIVRANYFERGVVLPPGEHRVVFSYDPMSYRVGRVVSLLSLAALAICVLRARRSRL